MRQISPPPALLGPTTTQMVSDLVLLVESLSIVEEADGDEVLLYRSPSASSRSEKTLDGDNLRGDDNDGDGNVRGDDNGTAPLDGRELHPFDCEPQSSHCHVSHCVKRSPRTVRTSPSWQQLL